MHRERSTTRIGRSLYAALVVSSLLSVGLARAQDFQFPATRAGDVARAYLESLNSGDLEAMTAFVRDYRSLADLAETSPEQRAQRTMGLHTQVGTLRPVAVTAQSADAITITVRSDKVNMWLSCAFELDSAEPPRLKQVKIMPTSAPQAQAEQTIDWDALDWRDLDDLLTQIARAREIPALGAAVVEAGSIRDVAVVGTRQAGANAPVQPEDRFHIGSIGKSMTATMIARLVELEQLDWDTRVGDVLAAMTMHEAYRDVTLEQLLQHRAGLPGYLIFEDADEARLNDVTGSATDRRAFFLRDVLLAEPAGPVGAMAYSNAGYVLAAFMTETKMGRSWEDLMREHVFSPMGLRDTGFGMPATAEHPDQPRGHVQEDGAYVAVPLAADYPHDAFIAPAGNLSASIGDLARFAAEHLQGMRGHDGALRATTFARLHMLPGAANAPDDASDTGYAAGWMVRRSEYGTVHTHAGSAGTFYAMVALYPEHDRAVAIVANVGPEVTDLVDALADAMMKRALHAAR